ncbi:MAG: hypothetical protein ISS26_07865 [Candidatus Omnitrophica bacterium]|nr:hypothetical protein [Candidatus Omnitrophota bacterium]
MKNTIKTIIFSTLITVNIVVWHEILGLDFLRVVVAAVLVLVFVVWDR